MTRRSTQPIPIAAADATRVVVVGNPDEPLARPPTAADDLSYVSSLDGVELTSRDVVVVRWEPGAPSDLLEQVTHLRALRGLYADERAVS